MTVKLALRGLRGESFADQARRTGAYDADSTDTDVEVLNKVTASAAELAGVDNVFDTKAAATAGLSGVAADAVVMVIADEDNNGSRAIYRKETGSLVLKLVLDAATLRYVPAGTDAVPRTVQTKLRERAVSVMDFGSSNINNGVTDATDAFLKAIATGERIFVPPTEDHYAIDGLLTLANDGQHITGVGKLSRIIQMGEEANSTIFFADGLSGVQISDLWLTPGIVTTTQLRGYAIYFRSSDDVIARRIEVSGHRRGAILMEGCTRGRMSRNYAHDSVINSAIDDHSTCGIDFFVANGGVDIEISDNICDGGAGTGIGAQSQGTGSGGLGGGSGDGGYTFSNIRFLRNVVRNQDMYGGLAYRNNVDDVWEDIAFRQNLITDITGAIPHTDASNRYRFGSGIYTASVERVDYTENTIARVCTSTDNESLAPGGIGITGCTALGDISGNSIDASDYYGIIVSDPNGDGTADVLSRIGRNRTTNCGLNGVAFKSVPYPVLDGAEVSGSGGAGVRVYDATTAVTVRSEIRNVLARDNTAAGVAVEDGDSFVSGVTALGNLHGVLIDGTGAHKVEGGELSGNTNWGLVVNSANPTNIETAGIKFRSNSTADIYCDVPIKGLETNDYGTTGTRFQGPFAEPRALANSATPSVKNGRQFTTGGTTTITSLSDMTDQQEVIIKAAHSVTVLGQALTSGKVLRAVNMGGTQTVISVSP